MRYAGGGGTRQQPAHPQYANYWAPLTRKRHTMPHSAQSQHTNYWAPRTRKRHQQEHRPQRPTERSDLTQHAKGRTGDRPGPRKGATTRRNVTQGDESAQMLLKPEGCTPIHVLKSELCCCAMPPIKHSAPAPSRSLRWAELRGGAKTKSLSQCVGWSVRVPNRHCPLYDCTPSNDCPDAWPCMARRKQRVRPRNSTGAPS